MKVKEESEKVGLKFNIQKTKIMAPGPITSWQIDGETVETVAEFIFLGSKITAGGDCSHEIKRCLLLGRKVMTNLNNILKSRDITLPTKVCLVKAMVFSNGHIWMWELDYKESWALKNWCFWPWGHKELDMTEQLNWTELPFLSKSHLDQRFFKWKSLSCMRLFATPWAIQCMEFSRPEYWSV